ncbi:thiol-disulfide isomerase/thioredoxin [Dysgonomonas sp. PH5-45]|uniref:Omp28-related outer membrane protein n=1 Tax=unclassified Dysgonomonas TaxID=2630389 RepID=UPI0024769FFA|nr:MULTISPECIES: Omp28-related outer membrane protein [unclassified Dysgonomonas]MDH6353942.1 thiol-disulfide isomerase/thioredoxin [Dysgonomonas sp. PH5-45]MDH6386844.1 thiol-disulfide isomerase/thioredoxin [Dysgonomonas sp. PH5-37]
MKRSVLFLFLIQFVIGGICAQKFTQLAPSKSKSKVFSQSQSSDDNDALAKTLGYSDYLADVYGVQPNLDADVNMAISLSKSRLNDYAGGKLTKVFIYAEEGMTDVEFYISEAYNKAPIYEQDIILTSGGWNEIVLETPFTIPSDKGIVMGYSGIVAANSTLGILSGSNSANCYIALREPGSSTAYEWHTFSEYGWAANVGILGLVEKEDYTSLCNLNFPTLSAPTCSYTNKEFSVSGIFYNRGNVKINSVDITFKVGDNDPITTTFTNLNLYNNFGTEFNIQGLSYAQEGTYPVEITFSNINGGIDEDIVTDNSKTADVLFADVLFDRKQVAEEATGTWCGWCPRGAVAMAYMKENYPDSFIGIAVHGRYTSEDPMTNAAYISSVSKKISGYPSALYNREYMDIDPGSIPYAYEISEMVAPMRVTLYGDFVDDTKKQVKLTTAITSALANPNAQYKLAFAVIENDVTGTSTLYNQTNYYAGGAAGEMGGFEKLADPVPASKMVYQEVARGIFPSFDGASGSVPATLNKLETVTFDYTIAVPSSVNNLEKTEYIVMLLDAKGKIVNADKIEISDFGMGINDSQTDEKTAFVRAEGSSIIIDGEFTSAQIYDAMGRLVKSIDNTTNTVSANGGLYIVKVTNGNKQFTEKVIVR